MLAFESPYIQIIAPIPPSLVMFLFKNKNIFLFLVARYKIDGKLCNVSLL